MWGKVKSSTHIRRRLQNIMTKLPGGYWPRKERQYALRNKEFSHYRWNIQ